MSKYQRDPTTGNYKRRTVDGVSKYVRSEPGTPCCCEGDATVYIQYRECDGGGIADLWEPLDSDYPKFIYDYATDACYYVYDDHPTSTTPGTTVGDKIRKDACEPCRGVECDDCPSAYTPAQIRVTLSGIVVDCCGGLTGADVSVTVTLSQSDGDGPCVWEIPETHDMVNPCDGVTAGRLQINVFYGLNPGEWGVNASWQPAVLGSGLSLLMGTALGDCDEAVVVDNDNTVCAAGIGGTATITPL